MTLVLIILLVVLLGGGGWGYWNGAPWGGPGFGIVGVLLAVLLVFLLVGHRLSH